MKFKSSSEVPDFERPKIEEGLYTAALEEVQEFEGEYGKGLRFIYLIEGKDNVKLGHLCSIPTTVHPETKLGRIFIAHGVDLNKGEVSAEAIVGTKVKVMVEDITKKNSEGKDVTFSGISKVKKIE